MCNKEKFWPIMARLMGHPEWAARAEYRTFADRLKHRDAFNQEIGAVMLEDTTEGWMQKFAGQVPAAPVYDVAQALDNPFVAERGGIVPGKRRDDAICNVASPIDVKAVASPLRFHCKADSTEVSVDHAAPGLGQHTQAVLEAAGFSEAQIEFLRQNRII